MLDWFLRHAHEIIPQAIEDPEVRREEYEKTFAALTDEGLQDTVTDLPDPPELESDLQDPNPDDGAPRQYNWDACSLQRAL